MAGHQRAPALTTAVAWVAGILVAERGGVSPASVLILLLALGLLLLFRTRTPLAAPPLLLPVAFSITVGASLHSVRLALDPPPPEHLQATTVLLTGVLRGDPEGPPGGRRVLLEAETIDTSGAVVPFHGTVLVTLRQRRSEQPDSLLRAGLRVRIAGRLDRPPRARNPGDFDRRAYSEASGIRYECLARRAADVTVLDSGCSSWLDERVVLPIRRSVLASIDRLVGGEEGALLRGILLGERTGLNRDVRDAFVVSGTAHVLAVSGSNVAVVAGAVFLFCGLLRTGRRARAVLTAACVLLYMLVTGAQPPVVRAAIMALVLLGADAVGRPRNTLNALGIAALVMLFLDTRQVFDVGFQLSFAAVLSLVLFLPGLASRIRAIRLPARLGTPVRAGLLVAAASLAATLGTLPLTALHFGRVSVIGLAANILVVPLVGVGVVVGMLVAVTAPVWSWGAGAYAALARLLMQTVLWSTSVSAAVPWASIEVLRFRWIDMPPFYALLLGVASVRRAPWLVRVLLPVFLAGLLLAVVWPPNPAAADPGGRLRVSFIDVGQGDAVLVEPPGVDPILIDAGPSSDRFDAGRRIVAPFLRRRGIARIGLFIPTHAHSDHLGGAAGALQLIDCGRVVRVAQTLNSPHEDQYRSTVTLRGIGLPVNVRPGDVITSDSAFALEVLWTASPFLPRELGASDPLVNDGSLVCRIRYGEVTFLFMGDAGAAVEKRLVESYGPILRANVLKVGHHGSATASTPAFLAAVRPAVAVISAGARNVFGHPAPQTLRLLDSLGADVRRTDEEGAVILESDGRSVSVLEWR